MHTQDGTIRRFNLRSASEHDYACLNAFKNLLRREALHEDPPVPYEEDVQRWRTLPDFLEEATWAVWDAAGKQIIACAESYITHAGDNEHALEFNIEVLPAYRRRGLGRQLLGLVCQFAQNHQRRLMFSASNDRVPASAAFFTWIGARQGLVSRTNQLTLAELDQTLIDRWMAQSEQLHNTFEIGLWDAAYPEEQIVAIAHIFEELSKDEPRDDLELEAFTMTPDILRQWEHSMYAAGTQRWTIYCVNRATQRLVGLTEIFWNRNRPTILNQGFTGVLPLYRNQGIGRWLKARMLQKILSEKPEAAVIRTGNANSNAPMLNINTQMGFKPFIARAVWQVDTATVADRLSVAS